MDYSTSHSIARYPFQTPRSSTTRPRLFAGKCTPRNTQANHMLKLRTIDFAGVVVGMAIMAIAITNYFMLRNICAHTFCPAVSYSEMRNDRYFVLIGAIVVGIFAGLLFLDIRKNKTRTVSNLKSKKGLAICIIVIVLLIFFFTPVVCSGNY
jgi:hypothetical protein